MMGFLKTWNIATQLAAFPCAEPNPVIFALTFGPAVAPALLEWASFGCRDIMKFRLGKGVPCGRALKGQVAKAIPPKWVDLVGKAMKFEHAFSYAGQMFLLADLASDTIARWNTLAYQMSGCPDANNYTSWDVSPGAPSTILPNTPTPVGGLITNENNPIGVAWPTGAIVPADWHFTLNFEIQAHAIFTGERLQVRTWIRKEGPGGYDFAANQYDNPYAAFLQRRFTYTLESQNPRSVATQYTFIVETDKLAIVSGLEGHGQASSIPIADWSLNPLNCIKELGASRVENPAGRNRQPKFPGVVGRFVGQNAPKPVRGPPGGMPRSKK